MPTYTISKQTFNAGQTTRTANVGVTAGMTSVRIDLLLDLASLTSTSTDFTAGIEWDANNDGNFTLLASVGYKGGAANDPSQMPWLLIGQQLLQRVSGHNVRFFINTINSISIGATITVS